MSASNEARADAAAEAIAELVAEIARKNPPQSITLVVACGKFHSEKAPSFNWSVRIGHGDSIDAPSYRELMKKAAHAISPDAKLERAKALRREAAQLEMAAHSQS